MPCMYAPAGSADAEDVVDKLPEVELNGIVQGSRPDYVTAKPEDEVHEARTPERL